MPGHRDTVQLLGLPALLLLGQKLTHSLPLLQSLLFLGVLAAIGLGLNLIFLAVYLVCTCCCRRDHTVQSKQPNSYCVTWTAVVAGLICW